MEILDEDFYELVANNKFLKQNLENEIRGFAIYLVNGNNLDIINSCSEYSKHKDIESLCEEINEICHNFATFSKSHGRNKSACLAVAFS